MKKNFFFSAVLAIAAAVACTEKGPVDFPIQGSFTLYGENVAGQEVGVFVTSEGLPQSNLLYNAAEGEGAVELTAKAEKAGFKQGNHMIYAYAPYAEAAAELTAVPAPDYTKQATVGVDPFIGIEGMEALLGLMLTYESQAKPVAYAAKEVASLTSAAITLPFEALNPLTVISAGEPGLEGANADAQVGKKIKKVVVTCNKPIAYSGQVLDLTTGKLTGGTASNSIELAVDITVTKMGFVVAKGFTFATCLTEADLADAKFKIEMFVEGGKTYAAEDLSAKSGGIYGLALNEVE
jgi:hypothetical protein